jgi:hypothetical protein
MLYLCLYKDQSLVMLTSSIRQYFIHMLYCSRIAIKLLIDSLFVAICHLDWLHGHKYGTVWYHPASSMFYLLERILMSPRGGWIGESWKSPLKKNLSVKLGYSGLFSGVSGKSGISRKISGVSGLAPWQRNEHTAQNRCHRFCKSGATGFAWQWLPSSSPSCLLVWLELKLDE